MWLLLGISGHYQIYIVKSAIFVDTPTRLGKVESVLGYQDHIDSFHPASAALTDSSKLRSGYATLYFCMKPVYDIILVQNKWRYYYSKNSSSILQRLSLKFCLKNFSENRPWTLYFTLETTFCFIKIWNCLPLTPDLLAWEAEVPMFEQNVLTLELSEFSSDSQSQVCLNVYWVHVCIAKMV